MRIKERIEVKHLRITYAYLTVPRKPTNTDYERQARKMGARYIFFMQYYAIMQQKQQQKKERKNKKETRNEKQQQKIFIYIEQTQQNLEESKKKFPFHFFLFVKKKQLKQPELDIIIIINKQNLVGQSVNQSKIS